MSEEEIHAPEMHMVMGFNGDKVAMATLVVEGIWETVALPAALSTGVLVRFGLRGTPPQKLTSPDAASSEMDVKSIVKIRSKVFDRYED